MTVDKRFALIDRDNAYRYPYQKHQRKTNRHGFVLGRDRHGGGEYTSDIAKVIRAVVFDGESVRVKTLDNSKSKRGNSLSLHAEKEIIGYWIAPELRHLVTGAPYRPIDEAPLSDSVPAAPPVADDYVRLAELTAADYFKALHAVLPRITNNQRAMLIGHASAPSQTLSMAQIAHLGGYETYNSANIQYGSLGGLVAQEFSLSGLKNLTEALATLEPNSSGGDARWTMRPALVRALQDLGLADEPVVDLRAVGARQEIDADPLCSNVSETTRQALVNARIGQGAFRQRMLLLWEGRCAVTGCRISEALIASHAKPWVKSSNIERLDEYNGLLLTASVDRLFDRGLISFSDAGNILMKPSLSTEDLSPLGLSAHSRLTTVHERNRPYLAEHRRAFGFDE